MHALMTVYAHQQMAVDEDAAIPTQVEDNSVSMTIPCLPNCQHWNGIGNEATAWQDINLAKPV